MRMDRKAAGCILLLALGVSGCGSSGGGVTVAFTDVNGALVQGPVKQAKVYADRLNLGTRGALDSTELVYASTGLDGSYSLQIPAGYGDYVLVSEGGLDTITNKDAMKMSAPAGSKNITPLTTLIALAPTEEAKNALRQRIEATGVAYDVNVSTSANRGALLLTKTLEIAMETLQKSLDPDGTKLQPSEVYDIQQKMLTELATKLATATTALTDTATLKADIKAAVSSAATGIMAFHSNITINDAAALGNAVAGTVDAVSTAIFPTGTSLTDPVDEKLVLSGPVQTTLNNAVGSGAATGETAVTVVPKSDTTAPTVVYSSPTLSGIAVSGPITVTFSEALDPATVNAGTFTVSGVAGTVTYNSANKTATFRPTGGFEYSKTYTVSLTSGITDLAGNHLALTTLQFSTVGLTGSTGATGSSGTGANF